MECKRWHAQVPAAAALINVPAWQEEVSCRTKCMKQLNRPCCSQKAFEGPKHLSKHSSQQVLWYQVVRAGAEDAHNCQTCVYTLQSSAVLSKCQCTRKRLLLLQKCCHRDEGLLQSLQPAYSAGRGAHVNKVSIN